MTFAFGIFDMSICDPAVRPDVNTARLTVVLGALTAFAPFATDMYLASFSSIADSLHTGQGEIQFTLSVFFFGLAAGQLIYGPLIDRFGRRWPLLAGIAIYTLAALAIIAAPGIVSFAVLRLLQALGGCSGMIISRAIIRDLFDERTSARVLASMMVVQGLGPILAPILGGYITASAGWRGVFVFLVLFGVGCFWAVLSCVPETLPESRRRRTSPSQMLMAFAELLGDRRFIVPALVGGFGLSTMFAFISGSPFVFMELHGVSQQTYGWLFGLCALGIIVSAQGGRMLLRRFSPRLILTAAMGAAVVLSAVLLVIARTPSLPLLMTPLYLCLAMNPLIAATATATAMTAARAHVGSASAIVGVLQFGLASLASALVGALHNGTAWPMAGVIFATSLIGFVLLLFLLRRS